MSISVSLRSENPYLVLFSFCNQLPSPPKPPLPLLLFCFFFVFFLILHRLVLRLSAAGTVPSCHGPKVHPVIGSLLPFYKNRHRLLDWYTEMLKASPNLTFVMWRLGARRIVVTANPENLEHMLKTNFPNYPKGKPFTDILGDFLGRGILSADGDLWHMQRKLASHEFSARSLREFVVNVLEREVGERLLPILSSACADRRVVDMQDLLRRFAFDTVCKISFGTDPGLLDPSLPESALAGAFEVASAISAKRGAAPVFVVWKAKRALGVGSERQLRAAVKLIHASIMEVIRRRKATLENGTQHKDLLSRLITGGHEEEVIRDMVISFVMAGRDTTSAALTWFFWLVSSHPEVEAELVKEAKRAKGRSDLHALKDMKTLEACLCESMRLYPPVVWDSKHAVSDDVLPDGTRIRGGDRVTYFPYGMGRMERLWGENCLDFDHRRWLEESGEVVRESPFKFPVFQAGPRICLGKEMAFLKMKYIAAAVLREFALRRVEGERQKPTLVPMLTAHMAGGLQMVVDSRK
ncbi:unnamed protein product [Musa acuminata var. zebrina]